MNVSPYRVLNWRFLKRRLFKIQTANVVNVSLRLGENHHSLQVAEKVADTSVTQTAQCVVH